MMQNFILDGRSFYEFLLEKFKGSKVMHVNVLFIDLFWFLKEFSYENA